MPRVDGDGAFRPEVLFPYARQNFFFEIWQTFSRRARNAQCIEIFPVTMLRQIALVQKYDFVRIPGAIIEMWRLGRVAIGDVETQVRHLQ